MPCTALVMLKAFIWERQKQKDLSETFSKINYVWKYVYNTMQIAHWKLFQYPDQEGNYITGIMQSMISLCTQNTVIQSKWRLKYVDNAGIAINIIC